MRLFASPSGTHQRGRGFQVLQRQLQNATAYEQGRLARRKLTMARKTMGSASIWVTLTCGRTVAEPVLYFLPPRIGNQKFVAVEQSIDLRAEFTEFPLMQGDDRYRWLLCRIIPKLEKGLSDEPKVKR